MLPHFQALKIRSLPIKTDALTPIKVNPKSRIEPRALAALQEAICHSHYIAPLTVTMDEKTHQWIILDGVRRWTIGQRLGRSTMDCNIIELEGSTLTPLDLFIALNVHKAFNGRQDLEMLLNSRGKFFRREQDRMYLMAIQTWAGQTDEALPDIVRTIAEHGQSLKNVYDRFSSLKTYLGLAPEEEHDALLWMVENKQTAAAKMVVEQRVSKSIVRTCIKNQTRLTHQH